MTYREFTLVSEENVERTHDENERYAMVAIMNAAASRGKGKKGALPSLEDLYKRPTAEDITRERTESLIDKNREATEWLSQFNLGEFDKERKEDE